MLIDNYSHSSAEDIAYIVKDLSNGTVVGMSGTAGGGGDSEQDILLPGDLAFAFPKGQTLDDKLTILIEGDADGHGGVTPDIRVPLDDATVDALSAGRDVVLERAKAPCASRSLLQNDNSRSCRAEPLPRPARRRQQSGSFLFYCLRFFRA